MPKKNMSPEERKAFGEKMKLAREAKKNAERIEKAPPEMHPNDVGELVKRIQELEAKLDLPKTTQSTPVVSKQVITKYSFAPADYPDPREKLFTEPRLTLKGFTRDWWDLDWRVARVNYEEDGQKYAAPRFELDLIKIREDEETGEPSTQKYIVCKGMFFEDPDSFMWIANQNGVEVPEDIFQDFMNEMRYLVIRDWVLEAFYPPRPQSKTTKTEMVINNRLVEVWEANSEEPQSIPFEKLKGKI